MLPRTDTGAGLTDYQKHFKSPRAGITTVPSGVVPVVIATWPVCLVGTETPPPRKLTGGLTVPPRGPGLPPPATDRDVRGGPRPLPHDGPPTIALLPEVSDFPDPEAK